MNTAFSLHQVSVRFEHSSVVLEQMETDISDADMPYCYKFDHALSCWSYKTGWYWFMSHHEVGTVRTEGPFDTLDDAFKNYERTVLEQQEIPVLSSADWSIAVVRHVAKQRLESALKKAQDLYNDGHVGEAHHVILSACQTIYIGMTGPDDLAWAVSTSLEDPDSSLLITAEELLSFPSSRTMFLSFVLTFPVTIVKDTNGWELYQALQAVNQ